MIKAEAAVRSEVYFWLSTLYASELSSEQIERFFDTSQDTDWVRVLKHDDTLSPLYNQLLDSLNTKRYKFGALDLASEFCQLFLGDSTAPYSTTDGDGHNPIFNQSYSQLLSKLHESYEGRVSESPEPADHLSLQLAYIGHIVRLPEAGPNMITHFVNDQVLNWLPAFVDEIEKANISQFYTALAALTLEWVQSEINQLP